MLSDYLLNNIDFGQGLSPRIYGWQDNTEFRGFSVSFSEMQDDALSILGRFCTHEKDVILIRFQQRLCEGGF